MLFKVIDKVVYHTTAFCFLAASLLAFAQVISRYVFNSSLSWSEEALRYFFVWAFFLAASACTKEKLHVGLDLLVDAFSPKVKKTVLTIIDALLIVFLLFLVYYGTLFATDNMGQLSAALQIPLGAVNAAIPVGSGLMILYSVRNIHNRLKAGGGN
jgi:TRAP-type C4-dicarboxylate transport system permease small subunit